MRDDEENGTFGLVLNRPLETTVKDACASAIAYDCNVESPLHLGGPCEGLLTVLHADQELGELEVVPGLFFTAEREKIERILSENPKPAKYFAGYSGWATGQLDAELESGAWILTPAEKTLPFASPDDMWNRIITRVTIGKWVDVDKMPADPSSN